MPAVVDVLLTPGIPDQRTVVLRVTQRVTDASVRVFGAGRAVVAGPLPATLLPGQDYPLALTIAVPSSNPQRPVRGVVLVRSGNRSIGAALVVRGRPALRAGSVSAARRPRPTATGRRSRAPGVVRTPAPRVAWVPAVVDVLLTPGIPDQRTVVLRVTQRVTDASVRVFGAGRAVVAGPLPATLLPGQDYPLALTISAPRSGQARPVRGVVLVRSGNRSIGAVLIVRGRPALRAGSVPARAIALMAPGGPAGRAAPGRPLVVSQLISI